MNIARSSAMILEDLLPSTGLIPQVTFQGNLKLKKTSQTYLSSDQALVLQFVSQLAIIDNRYESLVKKIADGIINHGINLHNNLVFHAVDTYNGEVLELGLYLVINLLESLLNF